MPSLHMRWHLLTLTEFYEVLAGGEEAWEGKKPGGVRVLLANPRWERRFVKFLELTGVGRTVADGTDEGGARRENG